MRMIHGMVTPALAILGSALVGCAAGGPADPSVNPHRLQLELKSAYEDGRVTMFEIKRDGTLKFGGGRNALADTAYPAGTLDREQFEAIWALVQQHDLLRGSGRFLASPDRVQHRLRITSDAGSASYTAVDDDQPGLEALHQLLMQYQSEMRYGNVFEKLPDEQTEPRGAD